ncbi:SUR7/PalI family-domain-containing protein [Macrophomina phaseolina]|uniref:SUR7/PalI family-domain-containing protein n=1 Tax=Macrophomina phaseolina TaxID=35725 RepID=A0ABQ8GM54_9PEZI|nr:SUR7/PalI family-domain-containing protein [Macrophomina phaseolina]
MAARPILSFAALLLLAGGIVFQFLVILSGGVSGTPENQIYFLQASTDGVSPSTRNPSRWTFWAVCGRDSNGHNADCGAVVPALPFDPPRNFDTRTGVPDQFIGTRKFFYLSRFMFAFYLIALFFAAIALFTGLLALCSRLGGYLSGLNTFIALFFQTVTAALMTAWTVEGRDAFRSNGQSASLGVKAYAFTWSAMACFLISTVLFCMSGAHRGESVSTKRSFFGRRRSTRSRGSFIDAESQRRVKDDYS